MSLDHPDVAPVNAWASRDKVIDLLHHLDHDADRVSRMVIEVDRIEVVYVHPIRNKTRDEPTSIPYGEPLPVDPWEQKRTDAHD